MHSWQNARYMCGIHSTHGAVSTWFSLFEQNRAPLCISQCIHGVRNRRQCSYDCSKSCASLNERNCGVHGSVCKLCSGKRHAGDITSALSIHRIIAHHLVIVTMISVQSITRNLPSSVAQLAPRSSGGRGYNLYESKFRRIAIKSTTRHGERTHSELHRLRKQRQERMRSS